MSAARATLRFAAYIRATCPNPEADSWVAESWHGGYPVDRRFDHRAGRRAAYLRPGSRERIAWADRPERLDAATCRRPRHMPPGVEPARPISVTFIGLGVPKPRLSAVSTTEISALDAVIADARRASVCWAAIGRSGGGRDSIFFPSGNGAPSSTRPADLDVAVGISPRPRRRGSTDRDGTVGIKLAAIGRRLLVMDVVAGGPIRGRTSDCWLDTTARTSRRVDGFGFGPRSGQRGRSRAPALTCARLSGFTEAARRAATSEG